MSIFRRDVDEPVPTVTPPAQRSVGGASSQGRPRSATHLAKGARITGRIDGSSDLVVEGYLEGQVELDSDVVVGAEGRIKGDISARSVRIGGKVEGNVRGTEKVEILASGRLEGDLAAPRVILAEGAFFRGQVEMIGGQQEGLAPTKARPRPTPGAG